MTRSGFAVFIGMVGWLSGVACGGGSGPAAPMPGPTIPSYAGTWTGTYLVSSCTNSGVFADVALCSQVLNTTASVTFTLAQSDRTVTGTFTLGSLISSTGHRHDCRRRIADDRRTGTGRRVFDCHDLDSAATHSGGACWSDAAGVDRVGTNRRGHAARVNRQRHENERLAVAPSLQEIVERPSKIVHAARLRRERPTPPGGQQTARIAPYQRRLIGDLHLNDVASGRQHCGVQPHALSLAGRSAVHEPPHAQRLGRARRLDAEVHDGPGAGASDVAAGDALSMGETKLYTRRTSCSLLTCSNGLPSDRIFELTVGR